MQWPDLQQLPGYISSSGSHPKVDLRDKYWAYLRNAAFLDSPGIPHNHHVIFHHRQDDETRNRRWVHCHTNVMLNETLYLLAKNTKIVWYKSLQREDYMSLYFLYFLHQCTNLNKIATIYHKSFNHNHSRYKKLLQLHVLMSTENNDEKKKINIQYSRPGRRDYKKNGYGFFGQQNYRNSAPNSKVINRWEKKWQERKGQRSEWGGRGGGLGGYYHHYYHWGMVCYVGHHAAKANHLTKYSSSMIKQNWYTTAK